MPDPAGKDEHAEMNRKVIAIGETVLDILFRDGRVVNSCPGGSMLNAAVSLGRAGNKVVLLTETGTDAPGRMIRDFLAGNGVELSQAWNGEHLKTTLALAVLDNSGDATYSFYRDEQKGGKIKFSAIPEENDIVLFGSYYSVSDEPREELVRFLELAHSKGAMVIYDPNFRKPHLDELERLIPRIIENLSFADLARGSDEDFLSIFAARNVQQAFVHIRDAGCKRLIYTKNKEGAELMTETLNIAVAVPAIQTVSTIGAGDSFNAGIIHSILKHQVITRNLDELDREKWGAILRTGVQFASDVCTGWDNFISQGLVNEL
jgi:fructokinase